MAQAGEHECSFYEVMTSYVSSLSSLFFKLLLLQNFIDIIEITQLC